jgi:arginine:ornithine antiporter/lysine permease
LWLSNGLVQVLLIFTLFAKSAYLLLLNMTSSMAIIPYLLVAGYAFRLARSGDSYGQDTRRKRTRELLIAAVAVVFSLYLLYVGGMRYLLLSAIIYAPGMALYVIAKRERHEQVFRRGERGACLMLVVAAVVAIYGLATGSFSLD